MIRIVYDFVLFLFGLVLLPKLLYLRFAKGKYKGSALAKLGLTLPCKIGKPAIWIHAVSLGETKAAEKLIIELRSLHKEKHILLSTQTNTGYSYALGLKEVDSVIYLPIDFRFVMRSLAKRIKPKLLILIETDFWLNMLLEVKKQGGKILLVNGKVSEKSTRRFKKYSNYSSRLFSSFDHLSVQNSTYLSRFISFGVSPQTISVGGNIKFDNLPKILALSQKEKLQKELGISDASEVITVGSTHEGEEKALLSELFPLPENLKCLLVPRHPERFDEVAKWLTKNDYAFGRYSTKKGLEKSLILLDSVGMLSDLYQLSTLAIVAGSFVPGIGGHNIMEPLYFGVPCLFGPHMESQTSLKNLVLDGKAGLQVNVSSIKDQVREILSNSSRRRALCENAITVSSSCGGATKKAIMHCQNYLIDVKD